MTPHVAETDDKPPMARRRYRTRSSRPARDQPTMTLRLRDDVATALELRATRLGRSKNAIVEDALARDLGVA